MANRSNQTPGDDGCWRTTIDGWVRDEEIRAHALLALAMVLVAIAALVGLATGSIAAAVSLMLPTVISKVVTGGVTSGLGGTAWWCARRRQRARRTQRLGLINPALNAITANPTNSADDEPSMQPAPNNSAA